MKPVVLFIIRVYQKFIGLFIPFSVCRFNPTCSEYMYQAINRHGIISGLTLGIRRILRCHPWNKGGYDPIPN